MKDTDDEEYEQTGTVGTPDYIAPEVFLGTDSGEFCKILIFLE